jgi:hypothetical protein
MSDAQDITIRVVVFKDNDVWVAQGLEFDIGAQADSIDALTERLDAVLKAEFKESFERHEMPFAGVPQAPQRFHTMWEHRTRSLAIKPMTPPAWPINRAKVDYACASRIGPTRDACFSVRQASNLRSISRLGYQPRL